MTHTRSAVALGAMLMATAASAQVQNGNFATDLSHWEQHGHKRATMGTAANPKIPKEPLHNSISSVIVLERV